MHMLLLSLVSIEGYNNGCCESHINKLLQTPLIGFLQQPVQQASLRAFLPCRQDLRSQTVRQKLQITYADNPQRTSVDLLGVIEFPNLILATQSVDFGCCLTDTMQRTTVQLTNPGLVPVEYCWVWSKQDGGKHWQAHCLLLDLAWTCWTWHGMLQWPGWSDHYQLSVGPLCIYGLLASWWQQMTRFDVDPCYNQFHFLYLRHCSVYNVYEFRITKRHKGKASKQSFV